MNIETKICTRCKKEKPATEFNKRMQGRYLCSHCKECQSIDHKEYREKNLDIVDKYGLCGYAGLMAAILLQAKLDVEKGDQAAFDWLLSGVADDLCFAIGYRYANVINWLAEKYLDMDFV